MWSQNVPERRNSKCKVPKADLKRYAHGTVRSVCAGVEGALKEVDEVTRRQVQRASFMLHGAGRAQVGRQHVSTHECGVKAHPGDWEGNQEATDPKLDGGKRGGRDGNIFDIEQAPGLLMDLDVGD